MRNRPTAAVSDAPLELASRTALERRGGVDNVGELFEAAAPTAYDAHR